MSEMDLGLDLGKKKKKKQKVDFGIEALKELASDMPQQEQAKPDEPVSSVGGATSDQSVEKKQDADYDKELQELLQLKKKKTKKKKPMDMSAIEAQIDVISGAKTETSSTTAGTGDVTKKPDDASAAVEVPQQYYSYDDFELPNKKKKRRPNITFEGFDEVLAVVAVVEEIGVEEDNAETAEEGEGNWKTSEAYPWEDSDRDYTYEELLERVFNIIKANNPNYASGQRKKLVMKPPQVVRVGAKKTSFVNFTEICRLLHRQPKHLMNFLLVELGTSASLDGTQQLIIKGKFQQKQIETVLRRYIKEYVTCHTCRSPETNLHKETRLFFLQCETCGSRCSVQNIKSGFQAVTGKRAQMRSKTQ
ncbi:eukaryotic translation initiation factor 2 subunit 2-like [Dysidea avara]|uniref:eukaryotic translation initiation factor 2 subunit 2-like n=1 Tax=Dysidea avara TaxID=196820 RepID=UPI0033293C70